MTGMIKECSFIGSDNGIELNGFPISSECNCIPSDGNSH